MSRTRIVFSLALLLLLVGYAAYTTPGGYTHAWLTGACFEKYAPPVCHPSLYRDQPGSFNERTDAFATHWAPGRR